MKLIIPHNIWLSMDQIKKAQLWLDRRNARIQENKKLSDKADAWVEEDCCPAC